MWQWLSRLLLVVGGLLLAFNVGQLAGQLHLFVLRNPATLASTAWLDKHAPESLVQIQQGMLLYFTLAPYALLLGAIAGGCFRWSIAIQGILLWIAYAACFSLLLIREFAMSESLDWNDCMDTVVGTWVLVPVYMIGVNVAAAVRTRSRWQFSTRDLLVFTVLAIGYLVASTAPQCLAVPLSALAMASWMAWRTSPVTDRAHTAPRADRATT